MLRASWEALGGTLYPTWQKDFLTFLFSLTAGDWVLGIHMRQVLYHWATHPSVLILRRSLTKLPRLASNLPSTCLSFPSSEIIGFLPDSQFGERITPHPFNVSTSSALSLKGFVWQKYKQNSKVAREENQAGEIKARNIRQSHMKLLDQRLIDVPLLILF